MAGTAPTPVGGSVIGDPYVVRPDGTKYKFDGIPGNDYNYISDSNITVAFRVAAIPSKTDGTTLVDRVTVQCNPTLGIGKKSTVTVNLNSATVDSVALQKSGVVVPFATSGTAKWWTCAGGESRIDIKFGDWRVAVIQDSGVDPTLHANGPLWEVQHLGLFIDSLPTSKLSLLNCIFLNGGPDVAVNLFQIKLT